MEIAAKKSKLRGVGFGEINLVCQTCDIVSDSERMEYAGYGQATASLAIILPAPTEYTGEAGNPFFGKDGLRLQRYLLGAKIPMDNVKILYAVRCYAPGGIPLLKLAPTCAPNLLSALNAMPNLKLVISMGAVAFKGLLGKEQAVSRIRGQAQIKDNYVIIPTYAFGDCAGCTAYIKKDIGKAGAILAGTLDFESKTVKTYMVNASNISTFRHKLLAASRAVVDIETSYNESLDTNYLYTDKFKLLAVSFSFARDESWVCNPDNPEHAAIIKEWCKSDILKIGHNIKFDIIGLEQYYKLRVRRPFFDTLIAHYIGYTTERGMQSLEYLIATYTDYPNHKQQFNAIKKSMGIKEWDLIPKEILFQYCGNDTAVTLALYKLFKPMIATQSILFALYMSAIRTFADIEQSGMVVSRAYLVKLSDKFTAILKAHGIEVAAFPNLKMYLSSIGQRELNINSPAQISAYFQFLLNGGRVKIRDANKLKRGKNGALSTDVDALEKFAGGGDKVAKGLQAIRKLEKLKSTYIDAILETHLKSDGAVHGHFNLTGTMAGRISSSNPNMQNIPARGDYGKLIKMAFIPPPGYVFIAADYSQIELRVLAAFANIVSMKKVFFKGGDIHTYTAAEAFGVPISQVDEVQRQAAKAINFGIIYGQTEYGLANELGWVVPRAKDFIDAYFQVYPEVKQYMYDQRKYAMKNGYVKNMFGLRIPIAKAVTYRTVEAFVDGDKHYANQAVNTPIQGTAGLIGISACVQVGNMFRREKMDAWQAGAVHDSLESYARKNIQKEVARGIKRTMESVKLPFTFDCPILADVSISDKNWGTVEKVDV